MGYDSRVVKMIAIFAIGIILFISSVNRVYAEPENTVTLINLSEEEARKNFLLVVPRIVRETLLEKKLVEQLLVTEKWIAIGTENKMVGVYNTDGSYKYSIAFTIDGLYYISYNKEMDCLTVYVAKANTYFSFDDKGQLIQMEEKNSKKPLNVFIPEPVDANGCEYYLSIGNKLLDKICFGYPKVMKIDTSGLESVFWDSGSRRFKPQNLFMFFVFLFIYIILKKIVDKNKRKRRKRKRIYLANLKI